MWMICQGRLSTMDRLAQWKIVHDTRCKACGAQLEDHQHLFIDYPWIKQLRTRVMCVFATDDVSPDLQQEIIRVSHIAKKKAIMARMYVLVWSECMYATWIDRCKGYMSLFQVVQSLQQSKFCLVHLLG